MDPLTLLATGSQGVNLLQGIAGLFDKPRDPTQELMRYLNMMRDRIGPDAMQMFHFLLGSPLGVAGMNNIIGGAQQGQNEVNRAIAGTGAAGAGVNILRRGLFPSIVGSQVNNFRSGLFSQGLGMLPQGSYQGERPDPMNNIMRLFGGVGNTNWGPIMDWIKSLRNRGGGPTNFMGQSGWEYPVGK